MMLTIAHVRRNPILLVSAIMAMIGWLIMFVGGCIIGRAGVLWWIIIYELLLIGGIFFCIFREVFHQYLSMFLIFLGVSISFLTSAISGLIAYRWSGDQAASAGAIILIIMQFFWVILFGSAPDSGVSQFIYSG
ncbi:hypothetical protein BDF20DRAFT_787605, partial [Mycotypha africana]|uniref:uncharacterized protein n=1 Tax=Mycotypha africana TaxID=64632 RepID=UPI0023007F3E